VRRPAAHACDGRPQPPTVKLRRSRTVKLRQLVTAELPQLTGEQADDPTHPFGNASLQQSFNTKLRFVISLDINKLNYKLARFKRGCNNVNS
jgi:hypothetical protein